MYSLYTNKVPSLHKVLYNHRLMEELLQRRSFNNHQIEHEVIQFVADSNKVMIFEDRRLMQPYLNTYFILLKIYYNLNQLKINDYKTNLMLLNSRNEEEIKYTKIITDTDTITPRESSLFFGWTVNPRLDYHDHLNNLPIKYTTESTELRKSQNICLKKQRQLLQTHTYSATSTMEPP